MTNTSIDPATITVPAFTPKPPVPKAKPVSAKTSSGTWPVSPSTLEAIKADLDALGAQAKGDVRAYILIAACIERGIDAGTHIYQVGGSLGLDSKQIGLLLHAPNAPWEKGPDGRYSLI
jgi:hypothetical protein